MFVFVVTKGFIKPGCRGQNKFGSENKLYFTLKLGKAYMESLRNNKHNILGYDFYSETFEIGETLENPLSKRYQKKYGEITVCCNITSLLPL